MFNKVILIGRLTADPVLKYSPQGKAVVSFTLAVDRISEGTDYFDIVGFEKLAEISSKYLKKGRLVMVEGRLQTRVFERNDGTKAKNFEIIMENMKMLDKKPEAEEYKVDKAETKDYLYEAKNVRSETKMDYKEPKNEALKSKKTYTQELEFDEDFSFDEFQEEDSFTVNPKIKEQNKDLPKEFRKSQTDYKAPSGYSKKISKPFEDDDDFDELFFDDK
jgi:single stranded DNA-binding protein